MGKPFRVWRDVYAVGGSEISHLYDCSVYLIAGPELVLIDSGVGESFPDLVRNIKSLGFDPQKLTAVIATHAHIDHSGYLPRFCKEGFSGSVHCTYATRDLCKILLKDSAYLHEEDARWANKKGFSRHKPALPLYTVEDAEQALSLFSPLYYGEHCNW